MWGGGDHTRPYQRESLGQWYKQAMLEVSEKNFTKFQNFFKSFCNIDICFALLFTLFPQQKKSKNMIFVTLEHADFRSMEFIGWKLQNWQRIWSRMRKQKMRKNLKKGHGFAQFCQNQQNLAKLQLFFGKIATNNEFANKFLLSLWNIQKKCRSLIHFRLMWRNCEKGEKTQRNCRELLKLQKIAKKRRNCGKISDINSPLLHGWMHIYCAFNICKPLTDHWVEELVSSKQRAFGRQYKTQPSTR